MPLCKKCQQKAEYSGPGEIEAIPMEKGEVCSRCGFSN